MSNFNELAKILATERDDGYANETVLGGIERFVENWAARTRNISNQDIVQRILDVVNGYGYADSMERELMIQHAVAIASQFEQSFTDDFEAASELPIEDPLPTFANPEPTEYDVESESGPISVNRWQTESAKFEASYSVKYKGGHTGIDYYLRTFTRKRDLIGSLRVTNEGIDFIPTQTQTSRTYRIPWKEFRRAFHEKVGFFFPKMMLYIGTSEYARLGFETEDAESIASNLTSASNEYIRIEQTRTKTEDSNIEARRLDLVSPQKFEELIGKLFVAMGYSVFRVGKAGDEGIDLICRDTEHQLTVVQCKRYKGTVGSPIVREFYGALMHRNAKVGYIITTGEFSASAKKFAEGKPINLVSGSRLRLLLSKYYK